MFTLNLKNHPHIRMIGEQFEGGGGFSNDEGVEEVNSQPVEVEEPSPNPFDSGESEGINPAWSPVLNELPTEFHNKVVPYLSEWDKNYHAGLEKVRNEVQSQYEPFQPFIENQVDPEVLQRSYALYQAIEQNPEGVLEALKQTVGIEDGDGDQGEFNDEEHYDPDDVQNNPRFQELEANFQSLAEALENEKAQEAYQQELDQAVTEIETGLAELTPKFKEHFGFDMDPEEVLRIAIMQAEENDSEDLDLMGAAQYWGDKLKKFVQPQPQNGFRVMPTSGGVPSANIDVTKLSDEESKQLVAQMLQQAHGG